MSQELRPGEAMSPDPVQRFRELVIEGRNAGLGALSQFMAGWKPKNPTRQQRALMELIEGLPAEQRARLVEAVRYCVDLSFFKLLSNLEEGASGLTFELTAKADSGSSDSISLIDGHQDRGLRQKYLGWVGNG